MALSGARDRMARLGEVVGAMLTRPRWTTRHLLSAGASARGTAFASLTSPPPASAAGGSGSSGALRDYFRSHDSGRGIYKWTHYFEIYERHFARFRGTRVHVAEVGVYSG